MSDNYHDIEFTIGTRALMTGPNEATLNATVLSVTWRAKSNRLRRTCSYAFAIKPDEDPEPKLAHAFQALADSIRRTVE